VILIEVIGSSRHYRGAAEIVAPSSPSGSATLDRCAPAELAAPAACMIVVLSTFAVNLTCGRSRADTWGQDS
jgi:hypothetical protein